MSETSRNQSEDLKGAGLKATAPRKKILELFQRHAYQSGEPRHLAAEDVYRLLLEEGVDIGLATVYRVLTQFEEAGLISRHHFDAERASYELTQTEHHDHLVCVRCDKVEEFMNPEIERAQRAVARQHGFELKQHVLVLYGLCSECQAALAKKKP